MKAYLVISGIYYENSQEVERAYFNKQKAVDFMNNLAAEKNEEKRKWQIKHHENPDGYSYYYKLTDDEEWSNELDYFEVKEIEIE